ncbi:hypothetical protein R3I94_011254 [Phoxinus phoxinus]
MRWEPRLSKSQPRGHELLEPNIISMFDTYRGYQFQNVMALSRQRCFLQRVKCLDPPPQGRETCDTSV